MERDSGVVIWIRKSSFFGHIRTPGKKDCIFNLANAPKELPVLRSVTFLRQEKPGSHDRALDIQLMDVV